MRLFNTPPQWPAPPHQDWRPPRRWHPPATWPAAPARWAFWVDEDGHSVRGPIGRYGGPRRMTALAMVVVPVALIVTLLLYPFGGSQTTSTAPEFQPTAPRPATHTTAPSALKTTQATAPRTTPVTHAPALRTERPTRQTVRTPTPLPPPPSPISAVTSTQPTPSASTSQAAVRATPTVYKNCAEVRAAGKAPLHRGDPGYSSALDRNGDGEACGDRGNS
ncbi:excalibur calcium-binding domain-containing protein [Kribbella sp. NPDC048928]|uniref:excalibur calcium-binding domain-containing protein n=1 Tax=Kribbella sp. NPDC048928 TaxID=3364111 RepID=UPI003717D8FB